MFQAQIPIKNSLGYQLSLINASISPKNQRNGKIHQLTVCTLSKMQRTRYHKKMFSRSFKYIPPNKIDSIDEISDHLKKNSQKKLLMNGIKKFPNVKIDKRRSKSLMRFFSLL